MTRTNRDETECHESFGRRNGVSTCVRCLASRPARPRNAELAVGRTYLFGSSNKRLDLELLNVNTVGFTRREVGYACRQ